MAETFKELLFPQIQLLAPAYYLYHLVEITNRTEYTLHELIFFLGDIACQDDLLEIIDRR